MEPQGEGENREGWGKKGEREGVNGSKKSKNSKSKESSERDETGIPVARMNVNAVAYISANQELGFSLHLIC